MNNQRSRHQHSQEIWLWRCWSHPSAIGTRSFDSLVCVPWYVWHNIPGQPIAFHPTMHHALFWGMWSCMHPTLPIQWLAVHHWFSAPPLSTLGDLTQWWSQRHGWLDHFPSSEGAVYHPLSIHGACTHLYGMYFHPETQVYVPFLEDEPMAAAACQFHHIHGKIWWIIGSQSMWSDTEHILSDPSLWGHESNKALMVLKDIRALMPINIHSLLRLSALVAQFPQPLSHCHLTYLLCWFIWV